jgi:hypothetical protein
MSVLSAAELAAIRADVLTMLPDTGFVLESALTPDGMGGWTDVWGTATGGTVVYRLDPVRGQESVAGAAVQPFHTFVLTLPYNATITASNRFQATDGSTWAVKSVDEPGKSWIASVRAYVERV